MEEESKPFYFEENSKDTESLKESFLKYLESPYWVLTVAVLVGLTSFFLGQFYRIEKTREPIKVLNNESLATTTQKQALSAKPDQLASPTAATVEPKGGQVVASKNGTKYHYPWCPGAKQISPKNLITFTSPKAARAAGLTPAGNCKGLK